MAYENCNKFLYPHLSKFGEGEEITLALTYMISASCGELASCIIRVPTEVVKQRAQAMPEHSSLSAFKEILAAREESVFRGLYRGFGITIMREIPFTMIQFPLFEALKRWQANRLGKDKANPLEAAVCGSIAGGVGAAFTTPLDVLKTRIMLARNVTTHKLADSDRVESISPGDAERNYQTGRCNSTARGTGTKGCLD